MRRIVLTHGLIAGAIMAAMFLVTLPFHDQIGYDRGMIIGYASMVAAFLLVFFGVRAYRDDVAGGTVSFGRALGVGALIVLVASVVYTISWQIVFYTAMPNYLTDYQAHVLEKMRAAGAAAAELEAKRAEMARFAELYRNPAVNAALTMLEPLPVGLVIALVSAGILRRRPDGERPAEALAPSLGSSS